MRAPHVGQTIVDSLIDHDVQRVFVVPGESYLAVLDGLHESSIDTVVCRHEGGAAYMAEAHGKFTGKPGVAMVTRGPGAANTFVAVHAAWQDATPMVIFVGLIPIADRQRESFQEFDPHAWFGTQAKRVLILDEPERASEIVAEAFFAASSGRPGPVIVGLPEEVLAAVSTGGMLPQIPVAEGAVSTTELESLKEQLAAANKPLIFAGGPRWSVEAAKGITEFAETNGIPVLHDWRASDRVPFDSPSNVGWLGYGRNEHSAQMFAEADVLLAIGALPSDVPTDGYTLRQDMEATNILVNIDTSLRGRSGAVTQHLVATPTAFAEAVAGVDLGRADDWENWRSAGRKAQEAFSQVPDQAQWGETAEGTAHMHALIGELRSQLSDDAVYTFGAGNHCLWAQAYLPTQTFPSQLSMRNGSMGYSIPAAVAASLESPERLVIAIAGDGEFLMNGQEIATAVQYGAPFLAIVMDNGQFGTIREHQEAHFPHRVSGTQLKNPDFAGFAKVFGGHGETVNSNDQIPEAVARALHAVRSERIPAVIHLITDPQLGNPAA
ncbi:thiamine pyrophosphate-dependent enzyme [Glutamicibacter arilaitensis]|uniref:thiamine pyrophosphate-dependent enzyme n=1 Tax=Glutamicibacter arilaitensis TaxID=256701 RepID=UPI003A912059